MHLTHPVINPTKRETTKDLHTTATGNKQEFPATGKTRAKQQIDEALAMEDKIQTRHSIETSRLTGLAPIAKFVTIKDM